MNSRLYIYVLAIILAITLSAGCLRSTGDSGTSRRNESGESAKSPINATEGKEEGGDKSAGGSAATRLNNASDPNKLPDGVLQKTSGDYIKEIDRALDDEDSKKAFKLARKALENDPDHYTLLMYMGICYYHSHEYEKAVEYFNKSLKAENESRENYIHRGQTYLRMGRYDEAIEDFDRVIKIIKDFFPLYNCRGIAYIYKGDIDKAMEDFTMAVELEPDYETPFENRGAGYILLEKYDKAFEDLNKAIEINPDFARAYSYLGLALIVRKEFKKGIQTLSKAIDLKPDESLAYYFRGYARMKMGKLEKAKKDFSDGLKADTRGEDIALIKMLANKYGEKEAGKVARDIMTQVNPLEKEAISRP